MGAKTVLISMYVLLCIHFTAAEYKACCGTSTSDVAEAGLEETINGHVTRLMELRNTNFGWENTPEVTVAMQLSKQDSFSNLGKTVQRLEEELRANGTTMSLGQFAQYLLAAKATCKNVNSFGGLDLAAQVKQRLETEFTYNGIQHRTPRHGWYGFYIALGSYCVTQKQSPGELHAHRALHSQNRDGSFDHTHSIDHTTQAMLSLTCLSRLNTLSQTIQAKVETSLNLASTFIMSKITTQRDSVWLGDKYASPTAVLAIKEHSQWAQDSWRCRLVMQSLNRAHLNEEGESAIAQTLMALKGSSVLALMDDGYNCRNKEESGTNTATILSSVGTKPSYQCDSEEDNETPNFLVVPTLIDIHISVHPNANAHDETRNSGSRHFTVGDAKKGKTLLELMTIAQCRGLVTFETATTAWGEYVTTINGLEANSENKEYWGISNKGESLSVGIGQFQPSHADRISFKLKRWH